LGNVFVAVYMAKQMYPLDANSRTQSQVHKSVAE